MRHQKNHLFLGIFVISGIVLIGAAIVLVGAKAGFKRGVVMESYFKESVTGLEEGSPVRFRGVKAGKVTEITTTRAVYAQGEDNYALVRVEVYPEILGIPAEADFAAFLAKRIDEGLRVQLTETSIAGVAHIEAVYLDAAEQHDQGPAFSWEPRTCYVPATASTLERFKVSLQTVLDKLKRADIVGVVDTARRTFERIDQVVSEADIAAVSQQARDTLSRLETEFTGLGDKARATLDNAWEAAADFRKLVQRTNRTVLVVQRAVGGRDLPAITDGLRELVDNLNSLSGMLERHPSLAVFGKPPQPAAVDATTKQPQK